MSKTQLKKHLQALPQEQVVDLMLQLYDANKSARDWLEYYLQPDDDATLKKYKALIHNEFYPADGSEPKMRFGICRQAISDFKKLKPRPESQAELMIFFVETGCHFAYDYGSMWEQYYAVMARAFLSAMKFIKQHDLIARFQPNLDAILRYARSSDWGFEEAVNTIYREYTAVS